MLACYPQEVNHDLDLGGVDHSNLLTQGVNKCEGCHGENLRGKTFLTVSGESEEVESCYECHGNVWNLDQHTRVFQGVRHQSLINGAGATAPELCGSCHGNTLQGKGILAHYTRPSCTQCHGEIWIGLEIHTRSEDGIYHAPDLYSPETSCVSCHGAALQGSGNAPSCYQCHGAKWNDDDDDD